MYYIITDYENQYFVVSFGIFILSLIAALYYLKERNYLNISLKSAAASNAHRTTAAEQMTVLGLKVP